MIVLSDEVSACSCTPPLVTNKTTQELRAEKKNYFLSEFSGAAFVGKIVNRERVNVRWFAKTLTGEPTQFQMYKYTIRVSEYWLGVKSNIIIVFGEPDEQIYANSRSGSSCGFTLTKGQSYFFTPESYQSNLTISQCDFAGGGSSPNEGRAAEFRKIMGEPKRF